MTDTGPVEPNKDNKPKVLSKQMLILGRASSAIVGILCIILGYPNVIFAAVGCWAILIAIILSIAE